MLRRYINRQKYAHDVYVNSRRSSDDASDVDNSSNNYIKIFANLEIAIDKNTEI